MNYYPTEDGSLACSQCDRVLTWENHGCESEDCSYAFCPKCLGETTSDCEDYAEEMV